MSNNVISNDDPQALDKLKVKLEALKNSHEMMKGANEYYRKHGTLVDFPGMRYERAAKFDAELEANKKTQPFPTYVLSGTLQDIRRYEKRIEALEHKRDVGYVGWEFDGGHVDANIEMNRLQVFFDARPDKDITGQMKTNGFKWAPSQGAWQRQLNDNAIYSAGRIEAIKPLSGQRPSELQPKAPAKKEQER